MSKRQIVRESRYEESGRSEIVRVALARRRRWRSSIVVELPRGLLTASATGGLEISNEKGNVKVGRFYARKAMAKRLSKSGSYREEC